MAGFQMFVAKMDDELLELLERPVPHPGADGEVTGLHGRASG